MDPASPILLRYETFAPLVHEHFIVTGPSGDIELELTSVVRRSGNSPNPNDPFTLLFHGPKDLPLGQGTYAFRHQRLSADIFIVPIGRGEAGCVYEAVFNP